MKSYVYLIFAIVFEVVGTTMLKLSDGFTKWMPTMTLFVCFAISFFFLVQSLKTLTLSLAYSIWSGLGTAGAGLVGIVLFQEVFTFLNTVGFFIMIAGVVLMNASKRDAVEMIEGND